MTHPHDLPGALPFAIAIALVVLIVAPWLGGDDSKPCPETRAAQTSTAGVAGADRSCD
jgi:hypothetical protein